jgi:molecular chaperone GrpE
VTTALDRDEILRRFTEFLDRALQSEEPPAGIDRDLLSAVLDPAAGAESADARPGATDSYALWSALTALSQEVKLQSRTFKELSETVAAQPSRVGEEMRAAWKDREREVQRAAAYRCQKDALTVLIDLRDRMARGLESVREAEAAVARRPQPGWLARLFSPQLPADPAAAVIAAVTKGYGLSVERLDQALAELNAREIRCLGEMFDPKRMNAIDREESATAAEGAVLEVYRSGYEWNGEVFRPAQVKVACAPSAEKAK